MSEIWYRYEDRDAPPLNEFDEAIGSGRTEIVERTFTVKKRTPKGVWIASDWGERRFVLATATKRFACATREEALVSFIARKTIQASIYRHRMNKAEDVLERAKVRLSLLKQPETIT